MSRVQKLWPGNAHLETNSQTNGQTDGQSDIFRTFMLCLLYNHHTLIPVISVESLQSWLGYSGFA